MKLLIAGFGSIGRRHFHNLLALGERDILFYRTRRSTLPEDELRGFLVETDLKAALAHRPDAVIIANPTALHLDVAIPAARAGCHLMLEKPVSHSLERLDELEQALQQGGGRALVGYQFRFNPGLQRVADLLAQDALGQPVSFHAHWGEYLPGWHPWEDYRQGYSARQDLGGGVTLTLSHPLDYLRWLFGEVDALAAFTGRRGALDLEVEDTAEIILRFENGVTGSLHLDYNQQPPAHYLEVVAAQGTIRWDGQDSAVHLFRAKAPSPGWEALPPTADGEKPFERNDMFLAQTRHFLAVVRGEAEPRCRLQDGRRALELALAALRSAAQGCILRMKT